MAVRSLLSISRKPTHAALVTPSDSGNLAAEAWNGLFIGGTGTLKVTTVDGDTVTFTGVPVGFFPVQVNKVFSTGTTATNIVALY